MNNRSPSPIQNQPGDLSGTLANASMQYKNPWTSVSRPMNGFIDVREDQWEANEIRKQVLAKELRQQMDEAREKKANAKRI